MNDLMRAALPIGFMLIVAGVPSILTVAFTMFINRDL